MQMVVLTDHDSRVLARRTLRCKAWDLGAGLDWAAESLHPGRLSRGHGGLRTHWAPVAGAGPAGCRAGHVVRLPSQPMLTSWARKSEDLTTDKTDDKDAVLIARLTAQLRRYLPEPLERPGVVGNGDRVFRRHDHHDVDRWRA